MAVDFTQHNADRIRRAESWLESVGDENSSDVEAFMSYWIAFNAAYGEADNNLPESEKFSKFIKEILKKDTNNQIDAALRKMSSSINELIASKYVFEPFWIAIRGQSKVKWQKKMDTANEKFLKNREDSKTLEMLITIFGRLYTLRNQVMHGGVTFSRGHGEAQLKNGREIMGVLIPIIVGIMAVNIKANPEAEYWGKVAYPRVEAE